MNIIQKTVAIGLFMMSACLMHADPTFELCNDTEGDIWFKLVAKDSIRPERNLAVYNEPHVIKPNRWQLAFPSLTNPITLYVNYRDPEKLDNWDEQLIFKPQGKTIYLCVKEKKGLYWIEPQQKASRLFNRTKNGYSLNNNVEKYGRFFLKKPTITKEQKDAIMSRAKDLLSKDAYVLFECSPGNVLLTEINIKYRSLLAEWNPDKAQDEEIYNLSKKVTEKINQAYEQIRKQSKVIYQ